MATTTLQGSTMFIEYANDNTLTGAKVAVCQTEGSFDGSRNVVSDETNCGVLKSMGPANNRLTLNAVVDLTPDANEASFNDFLTLYNDNTKKFWALTDDDNVMISGYGWIASLGQQNTSGQTGKFTMTIEIDGDLITP